MTINGPFGVEKTGVARLLVQKIPHSTLQDAEEVARQTLKRLTVRTG